MSNDGGAGGNPLANELVTFIQHDLPGLPDGAYQLQVAQQVSSAAGTPVSGDDLAQSYTFAVLGDRFRLRNPGAVLYSVFPPADSSGDYGAVLPHVVFSRSTFPWSRYPTTTVPYTPPAAGQDTDADVPTWLTVLLLDEDDAAAFPGLSLAPATATVGDLFPAALVPTSTLGSSYSYFWQATSPTLDPGDQLSDPVQVLDVPLALFWQLAPTLDDLALMAHVRQVSLANKATLPGISDVGEPVGTFSVVFGNRLPQSGRKTSAFLVSLEGLEPLLPASGAGGAPSQSFDASGWLRLAVLTSWTFYSTGQAAAFVDQVLALNGAPAASTQAPFVNLVLPYAGQNPEVAAALAMGFAPLDHELRTGEHTVSWYRGPLTPYAVQGPRVTLPVASPDQATGFDPTTGMLDSSYAAAWSLGRLMALQDTAFSTALYTWKQGLSQELLALVENAILAQTYAPVLQAAQGSTSATPSGPSTPTSPPAADVAAVPPAPARVPRSAAGGLAVGAMLSLHPRARE